ncbi:type V toxin-antitoxin system endoribonuclease antitoxin GhoS [Rahnella aceris]
MADFFIRVELFRADGDEYEKLHEKMQSLGFNKTVKFGDGKTYKLPTGSYMGVSGLNVNSVRTKVCEISNPLSVGDAAVFVCEVSDWSAFLFQE